MNNSDEYDANFSFLDDLGLDPDVTYRVSQLLVSTLKGRDDVLMTPIAKDYGPDFLLKEFDEVFKSGVDKMNDVLIELEELQKKGFGPRSIAVPWEDRKSTLYSSFEPSKFITSSSVALPKPINKLRPLSFGGALSYLKNDTNSGLPYYTRKSKVKDKTLSKVEELLNERYPCLLFTRTQEQRKTRNVWGYPIADTLNEMRYYVPLLGYRKNVRCRAALKSPRDVSIEITRLIDISTSEDGKYLLASIDFTAYDNSVKYMLQLLAFEYIANLYQLKYTNEIVEIGERFANIEIVTPDGILEGEHGVPSGSTFTNEVDSIVQEIIADSNDFVSKDSYQVQGDDGAYLIPADKLDELLDSFRRCGLIVNESKTYASSKYVIYLQNLFHADYRQEDGTIGGIYPVYRALNRLLYQERWSNFEDYGLNGKDYYSIRAISILENCRYHPLFEELVKFILKYDKYSLNVTEQGIADYIKMISKTSGKGDAIMNQIGEEIKGIKSFATYKLIKKLNDSRSSVS